jgi:DMSO/TMAO reductase YedYZ molybdopterin-dependent catalytic subunit
MRLVLALILVVATAVAARAAPPAPAAPPPSAAPSPSTPEQTVVVGPTGKTVVVTPKLLAGLDRAQATMTTHGQPHTYEGVRLTELLRLVGAPSGAAIHAAADRDYLVVTGGDGFRAVYSLAETDRSVQLRPVILADKMDGAPLIAHDAPYRLVVDGDQKPARSVYKVAKIEVRVLP